MRPATIIFAVVIVAGSLLVTIVGARSWHSHDHGQRVTWWWFLLAALLQVLITGTTAMGIRNHSIAWATFPLFAAVGTWALTALRPADRIRTALWLCFAAYCLAWLVAGSPHEGFPTVAGPLLWLLLSLGAGAVLVSRLKVIDHPLRDFNALIALGVLITYLPSLALEPLGATLYPAKADLVLLLWRARQICTILGLFLFLRAYIVAGPAS